jgi:hypothetical protein
MNTEAINTIKQIRESVGQIQVQLNDPTYKAADKQLLQEALSNLLDQEDVIINNSLQAMVDKLNASNTDLQSIIADMKKASAKIAAFADTLKKVSVVIGVLAEITTKAITAGLV